MTCEKCHCEVSATYSNEELGIMSICSDCLRHAPPSLRGVRYVKNPAPGSRNAAQPKDGTER